MLGFNPLSSAPLGAAASGDKTILAGSGTFTLSMQGAAKLISDVYPSGQFTSDGQAITFSAQRAFVADAGTFTVSGQSLIIAGQFGIFAERGTFALAGQGATVTAQLSVAANNGSFILTGTNAETETRTNDSNVLLDRNYGLPLDAGTFALTYSVDLDFKKGFGVIANSGTFASTVYDVTFTKDMNIFPDSGTFTLAGQPITEGISEVVDSGTFTMTVRDATFFAGRPMPVTAGTYAMTVNDVKIRGFLTPYVPAEAWTEQEDVAPETWTEVA